METDDFDEGEGLKPKKYNKKALILGISLGVIFAIFSIGISIRSFQISYLQFTGEMAYAEVTDTWGESVLGMDLERCSYRFSKDGVVYQGEGVYAPAGEGIVAVLFDEEDPSFNFPGEIDSDLYFQPQETVPSIFVTLHWRDHYYYW